MYDYITIERQYACGGHEIAKKLSKKLDYKLYDHSVVIETCKRMNLPYNVISGMDEQAPVKTPFSIRGEKYPAMEEQIFATEKEIILDAAKEKGCIFVGRCASKILEDKNCLKVFIIADYDFRLERAINVENIPENTAKDVMRKNDKRREKFFSENANTKWGMSDYFDLIMSSSRLGIDGCVEVLASLANKK